MILIIDNYDSFTYNLVQYLAELGENLEVFRNDKITIDKIKDLKPKSIVISPGPGRPQDAGISNRVIKEFAGKIPILGVCLGHQCIGEVFGGRIVGAKKLMHGKTSLIYHNKEGIFKNIRNPFVERKSLPKCLKIIAQTKDKEIMAIKHKTLPVWGVQFHPESILTLEGKKILKNFIQMKPMLRDCEK